MVYYFSWENGIPSLPPHWKRLLPTERTEKALQYKQEKDRLLCVWSFLLLRYALFCEYGMLDMPQLIFNNNGKPYDAKGRYLFNLSHCDHAVACAVDTREVGVDVQEYRSVSDSVIRKVCSDTEIETLRKSTEPEKLFAAFWASKEAFGKQCADGIGYDLKTRSFCLQNDFPVVTRSDELFVKTQLMHRFALSFCASHVSETIAVSYSQLTDFLSDIMG